MSKITAFIIFLSSLSFNVSCLEALYKKYIKYYNAGIFGVIWRKKYLRKINELYDQILTDNVACMIYHTFCMIRKAKIMGSHHILLGHGNYNIMHINLPKTQTTIIYEYISNIAYISTEFSSFEYRNICSQDESEFTGLRREILDGIKIELSDECKIVLDLVCNKLGGDYDDISIRRNFKSIFKANIKKEQEQRLIFGDLSMENIKEYE